MYALGVLFVLILTSHAYHGDLYSVEFRRALTPTLVGRVARVIGYRPREIGGHNSLVLYLDNECRDRLSHTFNSSIRVIARLSPENRCADKLDTFIEQTEQAAETFSTPVNHQMTVRVEGDGGSSGIVESIDLHPTSTSSSDQPTSTSLRGELSHAWAEFNDDHATIEADIKAVAGDYEVTWPDDALFYVHDVSADDLTPLAGRLARFSIVRMIEATRGRRLLNLWQTRLNQGFPASRTSLADIARCSYAECTPLWAAGIQGEAQIVSVSDTGVRESNCYFNDAVAMPLVTDSRCPNAGACVPVDTGHRTFRAYWTGSFGDTSDSDGHGTHVVGSIIGSTNSGELVAPPIISEPALRADRFDGTARRARVAFVDIHRSSSGNLFVPEPYDTRLLQWSADQGARIHSGSWGAADFRYSLEDTWIDRFAWNNRNFVPVFAAGNSGQFGAGTIVSPGLAKNSLTVGATMSSADAFDLASSSSRTLPADAYSPDWVADFSSRGSSRVSPFIKPDVVAPGGTFVWSANAFGTPTSSCSNVGQIIGGLAGTSMATPSVAGGVALVRDYFFQGFYPSRSRNPSDQMEPSAALVRALVVGGATPTRGVFPQRSFGSIIGSNTAYQPYGRHFIEGFGRLNLARSLPLDNTPRRLLILANEEQGNTLTRAGQLRRHCLEIENADELSVVLVWTDYPHSAAALVNDLDLSVEVVNGERRNTHHPNGLGAPDHSNNVERVRVLTDRTKHGIQITVRAARIGFESQSFALVVLAEGSSDNVGLRLMSSSTSASSQCVFCADGVFGESEHCSECGDGRVSGDEECDGDGTCCSSECRILVDDSPCNATLSGCPVVGRCSSSEPNVECDTSHLLDSVFTFNNDECNPPTPEPTPNPTPQPAPTATPAPPTPQPTPRPTQSPSHSRSASDWLDLIRSGDVSQPSTVENVCCRTWLSVANDDSLTVDPLLDKLHENVVGAQANIRFLGLPIRTSTLQSLHEAEILLNQTCGQFLTGKPYLIKQAHDLYDTLHEFNAGHESDLPECDQLREGCALAGTDQQRADLMYCSNGNGRFVWQSGECNCHSDRQAGEPDCRHRHCNGRGASIYDYDEQREKCVCLPGYRGEQCSQCAPPSTEAQDQDLQYLCVGLGPDAPRSHVLELVDTATLAARLDGSYYGPSPKAQDQLQNSAGLDCWCRSAAPSGQSFDSHATSVQYAFDFWEERMRLTQYRPSSALQAAARQMLAGVTVAPTPVPVPVPSSGVRVMVSGVIATVVLLWV